VVLDKTGTVTEGRPAVTDVVTWRPATRDFGGEPERRELLRLLSSVERLSEHPLGAAIVRRAREAGVAPASATQFAALAGRGVEGVVSGVTVIAGNDALLREHDVDP
jgi:Cu+-exporting ATPase